MKYLLSLTFKGRSKHNRVAILQDTIVTSQIWASENPLHTLSLQGLQSTHINSKSKSIQLRKLILYISVCKYLKYSYIGCKHPSITQFISFKWEHSIWKEMKEYWASYTRI